MVRILPHDLNEGTFETLVRLNSDSSPAIPYIGSRLDPFSRLSSEEIRTALTDDVVGKQYVDRDKELQGDFALPATDVENITLRIMAERQVLDTPSDKALHSEAYRMEKLPAVVAEGTHTSEFTLLDVSPELHTDVRAMVQKSLLERQIQSGDETFSLAKGLDEVVINLSVKAEQKMDNWDLKTHPEGVDPEFFGKAARGTEERVGSADVKRTSRKFCGVLEVLDPPLGLQDLVHQLARKDKSLKVAGEIITGKTRFAMLLFRKH